MKLFWLNMPEKHRLIVIYAVTLKHSHILGCVGDVLHSKKLVSTMIMHYEWKQCKRIKIKSLSNCQIA